MTHGIYKGIAVSLFQGFEQAHTISCNKRKLVS